MNTIVVASQKGKPKLRIDGHNFTLERQNDNRQYYWVCSKAYLVQENQQTNKIVKTRICRARVVSTITNGIH